MGLVATLIATLFAARAAAEESPHHGCTWRGAIGAAYAPLFSVGKPHPAHEFALELGAACALKLGHGLKFVIEPQLLLPLEWAEERIEPALAAGFNAALYLFEVGRWHFGPRVGAHGLLGLPHPSEASGAMWHLGWEAEVELAKRLNFFAALQYAGAARWRDGEAKVVNGPEAVLGFEFLLN